MNKEKCIKLIKDYTPFFAEENEFKEHILSFINNNKIISGKSNESGHLTASAFIINNNRDKVLLTHHKKLERWLQLGGHTEEDEELLETAFREAREESGLLSLKILDNKVYDLDVHVIPQRNSEKEHYHYDIRFLFQADDSEEFIVSKESNDLCWVPLTSITEKTYSRSLYRMKEKVMG